MCEVNGMSFSSLRIRAKLHLLIGVTLVAIIAVGAAAYRTIEAVSIGGPGRADADRAAELVARLPACRAAVAEAELAVRDTLDDASADATARLSARLAQLRVNSRDLHSTEAGDPITGRDQRARIELARDISVEFFRLAEFGLLPALREGVPDEARAIAVGPLAELGRRHRNALDHAITNAAAMVANARRGAEGSFAFVLTAFTLFVIGIAVLTTGLSVFVVNGVATPIETLADHIERDVRDRPPRLNMDRADEAGRVASAFDALTGDLESLVREARAESERFAAEAHELSAGAERAALGLGEHERRTAYLIAAVGRVQGRNEQTLGHVSDAARAADSARDAAARAGEAIARASEQMETARDHAIESGQAIVGLADAAEQAARPLAIIEDLAARTQLLSLNAAIEAARAGEPGRGFAVLADEIRALADRIHDTSLEVARTVSDARSRARAALGTIGSEGERLALGGETVRRAADVFQAAVAEPERLRLVIGSLVSATNAQASAGNEFASGMGDLADATREAREAIRHSARSAASLAARAEQLRELASRFSVAA
ncbi:MAG: methyl-accepting chemotaxis protein [Phycisphaerae bacterium]|nr:methyl-accepting chemotaxis protein [Phycisphaerae bacterium]